MLQVNLFTWRNLYTANVKTNPKNHFFKPMTTSTSRNLLIPYTVEERLADLLALIQNRKIITFCLLFSIGLHIVFLIRFDGLENRHDSNKPISHSIDIVLNKYIPEVAPQIQQETKPVERKKVAPKKPRPVEKKIVAPVETPAVVEEQIVEDVVEDKPIEEPPEEEQVVQSMPNNAPVDPALLVSKKRQYLETIAAHLDKHKFYPRSARRRHIEGDVKVSFDLLENGDILNLKIFSGHSTLQKATSESINNALPMPPRPESLLALNTMNIEYSMQFSLKD
ncbi:MAG: energy transducer TonB [Gammaproteobacteria bacterium]|nr:energy transducer TonB [Gammaproteobacteria bacterium]